MSKVYLRKNILTGYKSFRLIGNDRVGQCTGIYVTFTRRKLQETARNSIQIRLQ